MTIRCEHTGDTVKVVLVFEFRPLTELAALPSVKRLDTTLVPIRYPTRAFDEPNLVD